MKFITLIRIIALIILLMILAGHISEMATTNTTIVGIGLLVFIYFGIEIGINGFTRK